VLRKIFGRKKEEITGGWKKLCNEQLYDFYCSPGITQMIKSGIKNWLQHVAHMGENRNA
jgi:hypothetical protein